MIRNRKLKELINSTWHFLVDSFNTCNYRVPLFIYNYCHIGDIRKYFELFAHLLRKGTNFLPHFSRFPSRNVFSDLIS